MVGCIVPLQVNVCKFGARPILVHLVIFVEDAEEVIGMLFPHIFHAKVINYEDKLDRSPGIFPQACCSRCFEASYFVELRTEKAVGELA